MGGTKTRPKTKAYNCYGIFVNFDRKSDTAYFDHKGRAADSSATCIPPCQAKTLSSTKQDKQAIDSNGGYYIGNNPAARPPMVYCVVFFQSHTYFECFWIVRTASGATAA